MAQLSRSLMHLLCCVVLNLHLAGASLQFTARGQGCSRRDKKILENRPRRLSTDLIDVIPIMIDLVNTSDHQKATKKIASMLGDVIGCNDNLMKMITPTGVHWSSIGNCIRKDQGISHECSQCMPNFLQSVLGNSMGEFTGSCMANCASIAPFAVRCFKKISNPVSFMNCINPAIQHKSGPCLKCMHPHLLKYNKCADPDNFEYKKSIDRIMMDIASGRLGIQALTSEFEDDVDSPQNFLSEHQHEISALSKKVLGNYYQGIENFNSKFPRHRNENGEEIIQFKQSKDHHHHKKEDISTDEPIDEINFRQHHNHLHQHEDNGEVVNFRQFKNRLRKKSQMA